MTLTEVEIQYLKDIRELGIEVATKRYERAIEWLIQRELSTPSPEYEKRFKRRMRDRKRKAQITCQHYLKTI